MSKKFAIILIVVSIIITNGIQYFLWTKYKNSLIEQYNTQIAQLTATIQAYGPDVTVYTPASNVHAGQEITMADLKPMTIPQCVDSDSYVKDTNTLVGKQFKIAITPGTAITKDMVLDYKLTDDMRSVELQFSAYSVGLQKDDYFDIWFTAPYGDRYLVLSKIQAKDINNRIITAYLTETQRHIWSGACVDFWLNAAYGARLTAEKYVEPGIQSAAVAYYAVPTNIESIMRAEPNMVDSLDELDMSNWRGSIEQLLVIFRDADDTVDSDGSKLAEARQAYYDELNNINDNLEKDREKAEEDAANNVDDAAGDSTGWNSETEVTGTGDEYSNTSAAQEEQSAGGI